MRTQSSPAPRPATGSAGSGQVETGPNGAKTLSSGSAKRLDRGVDMICDMCGKKFRTPWNSVAGHPVKCPKCGRKHIIPKDDYDVSASPTRPALPICPACGKEKEMAKGRTICSACELGRLRTQPPKGSRTRPGAKDELKDILNGCLVLVIAGATTAAIMVIAICIPYGFVDPRFGRVLVACCVVLDVFFAIALRFLGRSKLSDD